MGRNTRRAKSSKQGAITRAYRWYIARAKIRPVMVIVSSIVAIFAAMSSIYGGVQAIGHLYGYTKSVFFENVAIYEALDKINTGVSTEYVEQFVGRPTITVRLPIPPLAHYTERIYAHKKYFLRTVTDLEGVVLFYSVTARDADFEPRVPLELYELNENSEEIAVIKNLRLGKFSFPDLVDDPVFARFDFSSKLFYYNETFYFGNPGFYKHYIFEFSNSGCCIDRQPHSRIGATQLLDATREFKNSEGARQILQTYRTGLHPNTFGVYFGKSSIGMLNYLGRVKGEKDELLEYLIGDGISVDYYRARDL